jgi:hypothetical protein
MQFEFHMAFLIVGPLTSGRITLLKGEVACPLLTMDRVTGETAARAAEQASQIVGFVDLACKFDLCVRGLTTDGAGYMRRWKKAFQGLYPTAVKFETECDVHFSNNIVGSALHILDSDVSGCHSAVLEH